MPILDSTYKAQRWWQRHHFLSTVVPALARRLPEVPYDRHTLELDDGDFLDLDFRWSVASRDRGSSTHSSRSRKVDRRWSDKLLIALHGLEGSSRSSYMRGMAHFFSAAHWDVLVANHRGCSGRINRLPRMYHMGSSDDVARLVDYGRQLGYSHIGLVGFSLGGNLCLKYLGEQGEALPEQVVGGVAFSVPCHIESANREIDKWHNYPYRRRFLQSLTRKIRQKNEQFPDHYDMPTGKAGDQWPRNFQEFDDRFTAPIHGFNGAIDYWSRSSSRQFIPHIRRPALLVNAYNDSFLSDLCYPREEAISMDHFWLETPRVGGHVGFGSKAGEAYWSEVRTLAFLEDALARRV